MRFCNAALRDFIYNVMTKDLFKVGREAEQNLFNLSAEEKRKYLFLKQIAMLNSFRERNAISKGQYDISYDGLISKMEITEQELSEWFNSEFSQTQNHNVNQKRH